MKATSRAVSTEPSKSFIQQAIERRIPQIVGIYIGAVWTFFGFVQWLVNRYVLSPHLEEFVLLAALLFLPSIVMLAYGHGAPGHNAWQKYERIGLIANTLIAAGVLFLVFHNKDMGSAQKTVQVVDAQGNQVNRVIPKEAFRKRLALFYFDNPSGSESLRWLQQAIPAALHLDLSQDLFFTVYTPERFVDRLQKAGFAQGLNLPMPFKRDLTRDYNLSYFISGDIDQEGENYIINTSVNDAKNGKALVTHQYRGTDILEIVDEMSVELKNDLDVPQKHIEDTVDLPVEDLLTSSMPAFQAFQAALSNLYFDRNFPGALATLEEATRIDPTFAIANVAKYAVYLQQGQMAPAREALEASLQHNYRLTEQTQLMLKVGQLNLGGNYEQAVEATNQWRTLYPDDIQAHQIAAILHTVRNEMDLAIDAYREILKIDPYQQEIALEIGRLLQETNRLQEAETHFKTFIEQNPDVSAGYNQLAQVYFEKGDIEQELSTRRMALTISPDDPASFRNIGEVLKRKGELEESLKNLNTALDYSKSPQEKISSYQQLGGFYWFTGQMNKAIEAYDEMLTLAESNLPAMLFSVRKTQVAKFYYEAGQRDHILAFLEEAQTSPAAQQFADLKVLVNTTLAELYAEENRTEEAFTLYDEADIAIQTSNFMLLKPMMLLSKARAYKAAGQYEAAKTLLMTYAQEESTSAAGWNLLGEVQTELGAHEEAISSFNQAMKYYPSSPKAQLGLARNAIKSGNAASAKEHLENALQIWQQADPSFQLATEARTLQTAI